MSIHENVAKTVMGLPAQAVALLGQAQTAAAALVAKLAELDLDELQKKLESDAKAFPGHAGALYADALTHLRNLEAEEVFDGLEDKIEHKLEDIAEDVKELLVLLAAVARRAAVDVAGGAPPDKKGTAAKGKTPSKATVTTEAPMATKATDVPTAAAAAKRTTTKKTTAAKKATPETPTQPS